MNDIDRTYLNNDNCCSHVCNDDQTQYIIKILLVSVQSQNGTGGISTWTDEYLRQCKSHNLLCHLINTEKIGGRQDSTLFDEIIRTKRIFKDLSKANISEFDVAHINTSIGTLGIIRDYLIVKKIAVKRVPIILHFHCDIPFWITNKIKKIFLKKILKYSNINIVLCQNSRNYLKTEFGISSETVANFVRTKDITCGKKISADLKTVVFTGRVSPLKGAREIYELAKRFPNIKFRLIGKISPEFETEKKTENVVLTGEVSHEKVLEELEKADAFLFPSYSEGFSVALVEAMSKGLPCIVTDVGANRDMIGENGGYVTKVGDVDAMQEALEKLQSPTIRKSMSDCVINKVSLEYSADNVIKKIRKFYEEVISKK